MNSDSSRLAYFAPLSHQLRSSSHLHNISFLPIAIARTVGISAPELGKDCSVTGTFARSDTAPVHMPSSTPQRVIRCTKLAGYTKCLPPISHIRNSFRATQRTCWVSPGQGYDGASCGGAHCASRNGESPRLSTRQQYHGRGWPVDKNSPGMV
jgi:hypothetical protein